MLSNAICTYVFLHVTFLWFSPSGEKTAKRSDRPAIVLKLPTNTWEWGRTTIMQILSSRRCSLTTKILRKISPHKIFRKGVLRHSKKVSQVSQGSSAGRIEFCVTFHIFLRNYLSICAELPSAFAELTTEFCRTFLRNLMRIFRAVLYVIILALYVFYARIWVCHITLTPKLPVGLY